VFAVFSLHRGSLIWIMEDRPLISEVVLSHSKRHQSWSTSPSICGGVPPEVQVRPPPLPNIGSWWHTRTWCPRNPRTSRGSSCDAHRCWSQSRSGRRPPLVPSWRPGTPAPHPCHCGTWSCGPGTTGRPHHYRMANVCTCRHVGHDLYQSLLQRWEH
jgi:hypothetical protein